MCFGIVVIAAEPLFIPLLRRLAAIDVRAPFVAHHPDAARRRLPTWSAFGSRGPDPWGRGGAIRRGGRLLRGLGFVDDLRGLTAIRRLVLRCVGGAGIAALLIPPLHLPGRCRCVDLSPRSGDGLRERLQLHGRVNGIFGVHAVIAGMAYACFGNGARILPGRHGARGRRGCPGLLRGRCARPRVPGRRGRLCPGCRAGGAGRSRGHRGRVPRGRARAAGAVCRGHGLGPAAPGPGRGTLDAGAPHAHLPALVRRGLDASGSDAGHRGDHDPGLPARRREPDREPGPGLGSDLAALAVLAMYLGHPPCSGIRAWLRQPAATNSRTRPRTTSTSPSFRESRAEVRILIVTHYFPPETGAPQARLSALAATWAADGDR